MVVLKRGELEHGRDVVGFEGGVVRENLVSSSPRREQIEHVLNPDAEAPNRRSATADLRIYGDAMEVVHGVRSPEPTPSIGG